MRTAPDLVDLSPTVLDAGDIIQRRAVLPEGTLLDIKDEGNCRKVHVGVSVRFGRVILCGSSWRRRSQKRTFVGDLDGIMVDRSAILSRT